VRIDPSTFAINVTAPPPPLKSSSWSGRCLSVPTKVPSEYLTRLVLSSKCLDSDRDASRADHAARLVQALSGVHANRSISCQLCFQPPRHILISHETCTLVGYDAHLDMRSQHISYDSEQGFLSTVLRTLVCRQSHDRGATFHSVEQSTFDNRSHSVMHSALTPIPRFVGHSSLAPAVGPGNAVCTVCTLSYLP